MTAKSKDKQNMALAKRDIASPDRRYWGSGAGNGSELKYMYQIGLLNAETWEEIEVKGADPAVAKRGSLSYRFPTPPKAYSISEPAAITIVPTQNGGKFVESQGNIFKDITLSGTVGLRPNPKSLSDKTGSIKKHTGVTLSAPSLLSDWNNDGTTGLPKGEITGLDDITFLRNMFRGYWDFKKSNDTARTTVMYWQYRKEDEFYVVEPMNFTTTRDSSNPLSWNYQITFRTLYRFQQAAGYQKDKISGFQSFTDVVKQIQQASNDIVTAIVEFGEATNYLLNLPMSIVSTAMSIPLDISKAVMSTAMGTLQTLAGVKSSFRQLGDADRQPFKQLGRSAKELELYAKRNIIANGTSDLSILGRSIIDSLLDDAVLTASESDPSIPERMHNDRTLRVSIDLQKAVKRILALESLFSQSKQVTVNNYSSYFTKDGDTYPHSFTELDPHNISIPSGAYEAEVEKTDTLRSLAKKYLGNETAWKKLAMVNNLKAPYISDTAGPNVLTMGEKIMIPQQDTEDNATDIVAPQNTDAQMTALSPVLRKYGRDIRLKNSGASGVSLADIEVSQGGDIDVVESMENVYQALNIKFSTEQGELATHPTFGARYPIGKKVTLGRLNEFMINTRVTVLQDPRIGNIKDLQAFVRGNIVDILLKLELKDSDAELTYDFSVRRA